MLNRPDICGDHLVPKPIGREDGALIDDTEMYVTEIPSQGPIVQILIHLLFLPVHLEWPTMVCWTTKLRSGCWMAWRLAVF